MKKTTIAGIILAVTAIVALCTLAVYLTLQYRRDLAPAHSDQMNSEADAAILALSETAPGETAAAEPVTEETVSGIPVPAETASEKTATETPATETSSGSDDFASGKTALETAAETQPEETAEDSSELFVIWVGDSRTLGMQNALKNEDLYIAAAGEGYNWFVDSGLEELRNAIRTYPDAPVVFNLGVNDYDNMDNYMDLYVSLLEEYPDTHFYFLAVYPIDPEICHNITNEEIADFNQHLLRLFPDTYLDSYSLIRAGEILPIDGIHYSKDDYRFIYEYAIKQIRRREAG